MDLQLGGKRALVTGSSAGLGEGMAKVLAQEGAIVVVHGRNAERCQSVADEIKKNGGRAHMVVGDLATNDGADEVAKAALAAVGGVDILVNNAGGYEANDTPAWFDVTPEMWIETFQMNTLSAVRMVRALVPGMQERKWGRVVNLSTGGAMQPIPTMPDYIGAKAAVGNLTMSLAKALASTGVTVNTVSPGVIRTPRFAHFLAGVCKSMDWEGDEATLETRFIQQFFSNTVGRAGRVEEIANMVAFLVSPLAGFITGANFRVDGGQVQSMN